MGKAVLALNAGSSSVKFAVYAIDGETLTMRLKGSLDLHAETPSFEICDGKGQPIPDPDAQKSDRHDIVALIERIQSLIAPDALAGIGHRIVHGGASFFDPVSIDDMIVHQLHALTPLAPLHQPECLSPIEKLMASHPGVPQVGCFDTAFHRHMDPVNSRLPLPADVLTDGLRRFGFHGLSFEFVTRKIARPHARLVIAHLGSGCSICAVKDGRSVNTTMGATPLDGLMMATRSGAIDPGVVLYLQNYFMMLPPEVEELLYRKSGLLGVSGSSADMRKLLVSPDPASSAAVDQFCARVSEHIAAMAVSIGGVDILAFTGGIGANSPEVRRRICERLAWLGIRIDGGLNAQGADVISDGTSMIDCRVVHTDEECMIASASARLLGLIRG